MIDTMTDVKFSYDPFSAEARTDPHLFYPTLLESHPAYWMPEYDAFAISRFEDVWNAFMDSKNFSEAEGMLFSRDQLLVHHRGDPPKPKLDPVDMFMFLDPPYHTKFRQVMAHPFLKGNVSQLTAQLTMMVRDRLAELRTRGRFDLNGDLGSYISVSATAIILGLEIDDTNRMIDLVNRMVARAPDRPGPTEAGIAARGELVALLADVVKRRRAGGGLDSRLLDSLLAAPIVARPLTDTEIAIDLLGILVGGTETVPKVLAGGLFELWKRPDQLRAVRADLDANVPLVVEEMLRYNAPAQWFGRTVLTPVDVAGVAMEPGQRVVLLIAAANRDPREFADPYDFIWNRKARRMLSFGIGPHFCIGIHLARLELQILVREVLSQIHSFVIEPAEGEWAISEFQVGWTRLPLRIEK